MHNDDDDDLPKYMRKLVKLNGILSKTKTKQIFHEQLYYLPKFHKIENF
jgi:hypothetical protein